MDKDLALSILKRCFPLADHINIMDGQLHDDHQNFSSLIHRLNVEYEQDRKVHVTSLVLKVPITSVSNELFESMGMYNREVTVYEKVIPRMNKFLDRSLTPNHLYTTESKILVLEDLTVHGYSIGEKLPYLNFAQTKGVLNALAHFHAASNKLYHEDPNIWKNLETSHLQVCGMRKCLIKYEPIVLELLRRKNETSLIRIVQAAISFLRKDDDEIGAITNHSKFKFVVLNHGDSRKDNYLYKGPTNNQVDVRLIDFQQSYWSSPLFDVLYFLITSVSVEVLDAHFDDLIGQYLEELNERVRKLDCTRSYKRVDYDEEFKSLKLFLVSYVFIVCVVVCPVKREQLEQTLLDINVETCDNSFNDACLNDGHFVQTIYSRLKFCEKLKVFDDL